MPADLLARVGKREEKISLGTKDPVLAKSREREAHEIVDPL
ncbi:DUF6538 domain-containing protein [Methylorubrum extorquens]|nr:DUF6538 domain-containing protein [Methylorubrum extorquens]